jgi:hypothetical protein
VCSNPLLLIFIMEKIFPYLLNILCITDRHDCLSISNMRTDRRISPEDGLGLQQYKLLFSVFKFPHKDQTDKCSLSLLLWGQKAVNVCKFSIFLLVLKS